MLDGAHPGLFSGGDPAGFLGGSAPQLPQLPVAQIVLLPLESAVADTTMVHGYRRVEQGGQHVALSFAIISCAKRETKVTVQT